MHPRKEKRLQLLQKGYQDRSTGGEIWDDSRVRCGRIGGGGEGEPGF